MTDEDRTRLLHMMEASQRAVALVSGISLQLYTSRENHTMRAAMERYISTIGEAAQHVSDEFKTQHQDVPWHQLAGMRNHLIHGYMVVEDEIVWRAAVEYAPRLLVRLEEILEGVS